MNKRILVTGAAGFIGSHLTEYLINCGYKVIAYDLYNSTNSWGWLEEIEGKKNENYSKEAICKIIQKKLKNREKLIEYIDKASADIRDYKVDFSKIGK